jgi:hypothetical protein
MTDGPDNIVLEHLRAIRANMDKFSGRMDAIHSEITSVRLHLLGMVTVHEQDHSDIAAIKSRLDRIEKRLELID